MEYMPNRSLHCMLGTTSWLAGELAVRITNVINFVLIAFWFLFQPQYVFI